MNNKDHWHVLTIGLIAVFFVLIILAMATIADKQQEVLFKKFRDLESLKCEGKS